MAETADILTVNNLIFLATNVTKKLDHYKKTMLKALCLTDPYAANGTYKTHAMIHLGFMVRYILCQTLILFDVLYGLLLY